MSASQTQSGAAPSNDDLRAQLDQTRKDMRILANMAGKRAADATHEARGAASPASPVRTRRRIAMVRPRRYGASWVNGVGRS